MECSCNCMTVVTEYFSLASRLGRRPKKVLKSISSPKDLIISSSDSEKMNPSSTGSSPQAGSPWDYPGLAQATLSDMFPPELMKSFASMMPGMIPPGSAPFEMNGVLPNAFPTSATAVTEEPSFMELGAPTQLDTNCHANGECVKDDVSHNELNEWRQKQLEVMSKYMHTGNKVSQISEVSSSESDLRQEAESNKSNSPTTAIRTSPFSSPSVSLTGQPDSNIYHLTQSQEGRIERFKSYCAPGYAAAEPVLIADVQESIISSHQEHCYHQRPIINAASAELDAKEQVI